VLYAIVLPGCAVVAVLGVVALLASFVGLSYPPRTCRRNKSTIRCAASGGLQLVLGDLDGCAPRGSWTDLLLTNRRQDAV